MYNYIHILIHTCLCTQATHICVYYLATHPIPKVGTVIAIWGQLRELADYQRLLEGGYGKSYEARWHVDPSLLTMVRAYLRNYKSALGPLMKRQTDTALVAIRVEPTGRKRGHASRNGKEEMDRLDLVLPGHGLDKLSVNSNVMMDYHPPTAAQLLKGDDGLPLRKMAEKGASANALLVARFLPPNGSMLCLMSGTGSSAIPVILRGDDSTWTAVEMDADVAELSTYRIGKAHILRARHAAENNGSLATIMAIQSLASAPTAFIMPEHNMPLTLKHGAALTSNPAENFEHGPENNEPRFEIKATNMIGHDGLQLGDGLYLRANATAIPAGTFLPDLDFYGYFFLSETTDTKYPDGSPQPGIFKLSEPLAHYSMEISPKCPGCKINDAKGPQMYIYARIYMYIYIFYAYIYVKISQHAHLFVYNHRTLTCATSDTIIFVGTSFDVNVQVVQDEHPATLNLAGHMHGLLTLRVVKSITAGQQVFCDYGPDFWGSTTVDARGSLCFMHMPTTLPSHTPGNLVYKPLPLPPAIAYLPPEDDDVSPPLAATANELLQLSAGTSSIDHAVTPFALNFRVSPCYTLLYLTSYKFLLRLLHRRQSKLVEKRSPPN